MISISYTIAVFDLFAMKQTGKKQYVYNVFIHDREEATKQMTPSTRGYVC